MSDLFQGGQPEASVGPRARLALVCNSTKAMLNFRLSLMRALQADRYEVIVVAPDDGGSATLKDEGVGFEAWPVEGRGANPLREMASVSSLYGILRRLKPDLCLCYTIKPAIYGSLICRFLKIRSVAVITGLGYAFLSGGVRSAFARALYRLSLRGARDAWFLNEDDRRLFRDQGLIAKTKGAVLPGEGVDVDRFAPMARRKPDGKTVFLMLSRLMLDKGVGEYLEAARLLKARRPNAVFRLAGAKAEGAAGSLPPALLEEAISGGWIEYLGSVNDVRAAIQDADWIVLSSYREGLSRSLLEAAAMERPMVASDVPGCRELVRDGETGFLAPERDAGVLARVLDRALASSGPEAERMGRNARALVVSAFSDGLVAEFYRCKIREILIARV